MTRPGDNGGPELDPQAIPDGAACCRCQHWTAPSERAVGEHRMYEIGVSKRPVKKPTGSCNRVLVRPGAIRAFATTSAYSACLNYEDDTRHAPGIDRRGFTTIWQGDRIVWQGIEGDEPAEYRQQELPL